MLRRALLASTCLLLTLSIAEARPFTDAGGRVVEIPEVIEKALPAGPPAAVLLYTLSPAKLAGWVTEPKGAALNYLSPEAKGLPTYGRLTGKSGDANMEVVLAAKPDIIIDVGTVNDTYISLADKVQEQTGIPYILIDGSFAKTGDTYRMLGDLLGEEGRAKLLADYADATLTDLTGQLATIPEGDRPSVYYGRGPEGLETGLSGSINVELLGEVGATNAAAVAGKGGLTEVSLEQILAWDPDFIIAADPAFAAAATSNPDWASLSAVKAHMVFVAPSLPFGWFDSPPSVNRLIGVRWLENLFYPGTIKNDLSAETKEFYKLFYGVDLSDEQVTTLLTGALPAK
ncbi:iron ABC transporter substrate-binding protein [Devosia epidermidihirudinis]|nr:iron ABC transporter substrate-binding protein [Devosia epidermidihirudinis]